MTEINLLDLIEFITKSASEVFDTMLSMEVESIDSDQMDHNNESHLVGTVSFAGVVMGNLNLHVGEASARQMTAAMLDMETDDIDGDEEFHDAIGERCNMICGDLKSRLFDFSFVNLNIPVPAISGIRIFLQNII